MRYLTVVTLAGCALIASGVMASGTATADPFGTDILVNSTCSFDQIDTTLHVMAPRTATWLDAHPEQARQLRQAYDGPSRYPLVHWFFAAHPDMAPDVSESQEVANNCHGY